MLGSLLWQSYYKVLREQSVQIQFKLKISYLVFCASDSRNKGNTLKSPWSGNN